MNRLNLWVAIFFVGIFFVSAGSPVNLVLKNGAIYTMETDNPWASAVVISGNTITAVLQESESLKPFIGTNTRVIDLKGKFVFPGFIDGHTHFDEYSSMICDVDLMAVSSDAPLREELKRVLAFVGPGDWIAGGKWDGHRLWNIDWRKREEANKNRWEPTRKAIDDLTPQNPCFLWSWDRELFLANTMALKTSGLLKRKVKGMKWVNGKPTGLFYKGSPGIDVIKSLIQPKTEKRILKGMAAGFRNLAEMGIVEIHDITPLDYVPRFVQLQKDGALTARVWMRPDLSRGEIIKRDGIVMNSHPVTGIRDHYLRYGAFKAYLDGLMGSHGALLFEPYTDKPETSGHFRLHSSDEPAGFKKGNLEKMYRLMKTGIEAGFVINTHAIGDRGAALCLDLYECLEKEFGLDRIKRSRVIHAQTIRPVDFPRFKKLGVIAEVTPSNLADDLRWIVRRLGPEREKLSHPYKRFLEHQVLLTGGSDIPGAQGATFDCHPRAMIHAVVNRNQKNGQPDGGWLPEYKLTVHEAIKMYTIDAAYSVFDEKIRGSIKRGKLADFTICDQNLMKIDPKDILKTNILMTIVDGKIVFEK